MTAVVCNVCIEITIKTKLSKVFLIRRFLDPIRTAKRLTIISILLQLVIVLILVRTLFTQQINAPHLEHESQYGKCFQVH